MARRSTGATVRSMIVVGLIGIALAAVGAYQYSTRNDAPTCDGHTMGHRDICEVTNHGVTTNKTYEDMQSEGTVGSIILLAIGGVVGGGAGVGGGARRPPKRGAGARGTPDRAAQTA